MIEVTSDPSIKLRGLIEVTSYPSIRLDRVNLGHQLPVYLVKEG